MEHSERCYLTDPDVNRKLSLNVWGLSWVFQGFLFIVLICLILSISDQRQGVQNCCISTISDVGKVWRDSQWTGRLLQNSTLILVMWVQANNRIYLKNRTPRTNVIWQGYTFGCSHHIQTTRNMGLFFYFPGIYKEWDKERHRKQWSYAHWLSEDNPGDIASLWTLLQPESTGNLSHPHPLWQGSFKWYFIPLSLPSWPLCGGPQESYDFCVPSLLRVCHKWHFIASCGSKDQNSFAQEVPVYRMDLTLKMITTFRVLEVNGESLNSVGLYRQNTKDCTGPIY